MSFETVMPPFNASDPNARFLSASCLDFLLIELVPLAYRVTNDLDAAAAEKEEGSGSIAALGSQSAKAAAPAISTGTARNLDDDEERDAVFFRLDAIGYRVGQGLVER